MSVSEALKRKKKLKSWTLSNFEIFQMDKKACAYELFDPPMKFSCYLRLLTCQKSQYLARFLKTVMMILAVGISPLTFTWTDGM